MKLKALRMIVALVVFGTLLPVLTGGCPCAYAGDKPYHGLLLQKVPCHGCCPEIKTGRPHEAFEPVEPAGFHDSRQQARLYSSHLEKLSFLFPPPIDPLSGKAPPGTTLSNEYTPFSQSSLYLSLQVFRI